MIEEKIKDIMSSYDWSGEMKSFNKKTVKKLNNTLKEAGSLEDVKLLKLPKPQNLYNNAIKTKSFKVCEYLFHHPEFMRKIYSTNTSYVQPEMLPMDTVKVFNTKYEEYKKTIKKNNSPNIQA